MPIVKMPDGQLVEMPDNPTPEQAQKLKAAFDQQRKTIASVPVANPQDRPWYAGITDDLKNIGSSIYKGLASLPAAAADVLAAQPDAADAIASRAAGRQLRPLGDMSSPATTALQATGYQPKTRGEQIASALTQGAAGALVSPGGLTNPIRTGLVGASSAAGAEGAAAALGEGVPQRVIGGLLGGLAGGVATAAKTNRQSMAREALEGLSPEDLQRAQANMQSMRAAGVPGNLSQALERPSNIDTIVDALANNQYGTKVQAQLRAQPQQTRMALETEVAQLPGDIRTPQQSANNMQNVTTAAIDAARRQRSNAWESTRAAAEAQMFPGTRANVAPKLVMNVIQDLDDMAAARPNTAVAEQLMTLRNKLLDGEGNPLTSPKQLNEILKEATTRLKSPDLATKGVDAGQAKFLGQTIDNIRQDLGPAFEPIRKANTVYRQVTEDVVNPLKKSVVGRIAGRRGELADTEAVRGRMHQLLEQGTVPGAKASDILKLEKEIRQIKAGQYGAEIDGPIAYQDAVKSWIGEKISAAVQPVGGRLNEDLPKRLNDAFAGNETRSQGFRDMLVGMARSQNLPDNALYPGMEKFLKVVGNVSRRPGSVAGSTRQGLDEMAEASAFGSVGRFSAITPVRQPILKWMDYLKADAYKAMDDILTNPEGVAMLQKLAKQNAMSPTAANTVATFLATLGAQRPGEVPENQPETFSTQRKQVNP